MTSGIECKNTKWRPGEASPLDEDAMGEGKAVNVSVPCPRQCASDSSVSAGPELTKSLLKSSPELPGTAASGTEPIHRSNFPVPVGTYSTTQLLLLYSSTYIGKVNSLPAEVRCKRNAVLTVQKSSAPHLDFSCYVQYFYCLFTVNKPACLHCLIGDCHSTYC